MPCVFMCVFATSFGGSEGASINVEARDLDTNLVKWGVSISKHMVGVTREWTGTSSVNTDDKHVPVMIY